MDMDALRELIAQSRVQLRVFDAETQGWVSWPVSESEPPNEAHPAHAYAIDEWASAMRAMVALGMRPLEPGRLPADRATFRLIEAGARLARQLGECTTRYAAVQTLEQAAKEGGAAAELFSMRHLVAPIDPDVTTSEHGCTSVRCAYPDDCRCCSGVNAPEPRGE